MKLGVEVGLGPDNIVSDGDPAPPLPILCACLLRPKAGWIKMPLGTELCLGLGDIVLDGDPAPP